MPSKKNKDKRERYKWCSKKIVHYPGTTQTWVHLDTGKSEGTSPMLHNAMPRSRN